MTHNTLDRIMSKALHSDSNITKSEYIELLDIAIQMAESLSAHTDRLTEFLEKAVEK